MSARTGPLRVVVVGGGFGGLSAALALRRLDVDVTVIDRRNFHLFQPLLYQVATGALSPGDIASPLRTVLGRHEGTTVLLGEVVGIDPDARDVLLADGARVPYDLLVLAPGSQTSYFGHDEWEAAAPGLKTLEDAEVIRRRVLLAFEAAERESDPEARARLLTFVIVGGGPTGVELAGAIAEIARDVLRRRFRHIDPTAARVVLVELGPRILSTFAQRTSRRAGRDLERLRVQVRAGTEVSGIDADGVTLRRGDSQERIHAATVLWTAGVRATPLVAGVAQALGQAVDRGGRIPVTPDLSVPGHPEVMVIGDAAVAAGGGPSWPGVAPVAMQQGAHVGRFVAARLEGRPAPRFRYRNKGNLATIGTGTAVAELGRLRFGGRVAWILWLFVHIEHLVLFQSRLLVLVQWAWSFFTRGRTSLLITGPSRERRPDAIGR